MMKQIRRIVKRSERGQAIILIAAAMIGLVAMVGLVTDTGILLINYGNLKRGVDAAAVAAAQQYRQKAASSQLDSVALENTAKSFLQLNQKEVVITSVDIHSCDALDPARPALCNPIGGPDIENRKLVEVTASATVNFTFLSVVGIRSTTITATSIGEAATIDLVLVIDTSASMAFETSGSLSGSDEGDDPSVCNPDNCSPMKEVKAVAADFVEKLYFPYDRVAIVTMTSQDPDGNRTPIIKLPLNSSKATVVAEIEDITVFEPPSCDGTAPFDTPGTCLQYSGSTFVRAYCEIFQENTGANPDGADPTTCPSSNVGGTMALARTALTGNGNINNQRLDAFWVVIALIGGPANSTDPLSGYINGMCPRNTWWPTGVPSGKQQPLCRDMEPSVRHRATDPTFAWEHPVTGTDFNVLPYDADDYARDMADALATTTSGDGVTIYTIGLGDQITNDTTVLASEPKAAGESLLEYIATCAGEGDFGDCSSVVTKQINHGQYFNAKFSAQLDDIFDQIANNIATKISQ